MRSLRTALFCTWWCAGRSVNPMSASTNREFEQPVERPGGMYIRRPKPPPAAAAGGAVQAGSSPRPQLNLSGGAAASAVAPAPTTTGSRGQKPWLRAAAAPPPPPAAVIDTSAVSESYAHGTNARVAVGGRSAGTAVTGTGTGSGNTTTAVTDISPTLPSTVVVGGESGQSVPVRPVRPLPVQSTSSTAGGRVRNAVGGGVFSSLSSFAGFIRMALGHRYTYRLIAAFGLVVATVLCYKFYLARKRAAAAAAELRDQRNTHSFACSQCLGYQQSLASYHTYVLIVCSPRDTLFRSHALQLHLQARSSAFAPVQPFARFRDCV